MDRSTHRANKQLIKISLHWTPKLRKLKAPKTKRYKKWQN